MDFRGRYEVKSDGVSESTLTINGLVTWPGQRNLDDGFGILIAMETENNQSEWVALNWDPNRDKWLFYSSYNQCNIADMKECAKPENLGKFKFDSTWKDKGQ